MTPIRYGYNLHVLARRQAELGLNDGELGEKAQCSYKTIENFHKGLSMTPRTVKKLADALGVDLATIVVPLSSHAITPRAPRGPQAARRKAVRK